MTETRYNLTVTEPQAEATWKACDFYSRVLSGQFNPILDEFRFREGVTLETVERAETLLAELQALLVPDAGNSGYGIRHPKVPETAKIAYDLELVIRHRLAHDRDPNGTTGGVYRYEPLRVSETCELATMRRQEP